MISEALKHEKFEFDVLRGIQNDLFSYINSMCTGPVSLGDREQVGSREIEQIKLKFKSIDTEIIRRIVDSNRPQTTGQDRRNFVSNRLISQHKIMPRNLTDEMKHEIHELLDEYNGLDDNDLKITYLQNFNGYSCRYDLYRDSIFIEFLEDQIKNGTDKHIILEEIKNLVPNQQLCECTGCV